MLKKIARTSAGILAVIALSGFAPARSGFAFIPMENPEWAHIFFGGAAALQVHGFLQAQNEIGCDVDGRGWATCRAWINREGDIRATAPQEAGRPVFKGAVQGSVLGASDSPNEKGLLLFGAENAGLSKFLAAPAGQDLDCTSGVCRFGVDVRGEVEPQ